MVYWWWIWNICCAYTGKNFKWLLCSKGNKPQREYAHIPQSICIFMSVFPTSNYCHTFSAFFFHEKIHGKYNSSEKSMYKEYLLESVFPWRRTEHTGSSRILVTLHFCIGYAFVFNVWISSQHYAEFDNVCNMHIAQIDITVLFIDLRRTPKIYLLVDYDYSPFTKLIY